MSNLCQTLSEIFVAVRITNIATNYAILDSIVELSMEYGQQLATYMTGKSAAERLKLAKQLVYALIELECYGCIHGDIKLENAIVTSDGRVKLIDFGIVTTVGQTKIVRTQTHKNLNFTGYSHIRCALYALHVSLTSLTDEMIINKNATTIAESTYCTDSTFFTIDSIKLHFEPHGLALIYGWCCQYRLSENVCTNACYRYSDVCSALSYSRDKLNNQDIACVCLNLTLGLHGDYNKAVASMISINNGAIRLVIDNTIARCLNYHLNTLELIAFCFSDTYHYDISNKEELTLADDDDFYDKVNALTLRLNIKLKTVIYDDCIVDV